MSIYDNLPPEEVVYVTSQKIARELKHSEPEIKKPLDLKKISGIKKAAPELQKYIEDIDSNETPDDDIIIGGSSATFTQVKKFRVPKDLDISTPFLDKEVRNISAILRKNYGVSNVVVSPKFRTEMDGHDVDVVQIKIKDSRGNLVITFAQLGVTIPIPVLGGISYLVHNNINNINELRKKLTFTEIYKEKRLNPETGEEEEEVEIGRAEKMKNDIIITGYNFNDFITLLKQSEEEKLIPLVVESVPDFVERNISADYTEKKIKIRQMLNTKDEPNNDGMKIMVIAVAVATIFIIGMFFK